MGKLFCIIGKSASGKDTIYQQLVADRGLALKTVVPYTTRPVRADEHEGVNYHFVTESVFNEMAAEHKIIEDRAYNTIYGIWRYFTADDGQIQLETGNYIMIGTLEAYLKIRDYFGRENVMPVYIEVEDGKRLERALFRERQQAVPKYAEMCRRFLADAEDFSEEKIQTAEIAKRYDNGCSNGCIMEIREDIMKYCTL